MPARTSPPDPPPTDPTGRCVGPDKAEGPALDPGALEDSFLPFAEAHERRVGALSAIVASERELSAALDAAAGLAGHRPPAPVGLLDQALTLLGFHEEAPPPPPPDAHTRYEAALAALRALGHQLTRLESEQNLLRRDRDLCRQRQQRATRDRDRSRAAAAQTAAPDARAQQDRNARRYDAERQRAADMIALQDELVPVLDRVHTSVADLHSAARGAVRVLARQLTDDALAAADDQLRRGLGATDRLVALRDAVRKVQGLVDEAAAHVDRERDALHRRLRMLDADAEARRAAEAEVDALLRRSGAERLP